MDAANAGTSAGVDNPSLGRVPAGERVFGWHEHGSLWFSLGVGLLVMQMGAYLVPSVGTLDAALAIALGTAIGAGLLAWTAWLGAHSGLTSAGLMHHTYGRRFARLPVFLNIAQLIGWSTFELVIMRDSTVAIGQRSFGAAFATASGATATTLLWGGVLTLLLTGSMTRLVRKIIGRYGLPLVLASLLWLSWQFGSRVQAGGLHGFLARSGNGSMGLLAAMDLVIAMPVSWLPLVADYARFGKSGKGAFLGAWIGYAVANVWCYALGMMVASVSAPDADLVNTLLLAQGGLIALSLIMVDEIDNAYGDIYSGAVSCVSLEPRWSLRRWGMVLALASTALALVLPMRALEPFLLVLSSVFVPLYGVILGRLGLGRGRCLVAAPAADATAAGIWLFGIAVFTLLSGQLQQVGITLFQPLTDLAPHVGATLPTLLLTIAAAALTRRKAVISAEESWRAVRDCG